MSDAVLDHHVANWGIYETESRKHGHAPDRSKWRITLMMHIAETREKAYADAAWGFREFNNYSHDIVPAPPAIPRDTDDLVAAAIEKQVAIIGTPDDAIREIERVRQKLGGFGAVLLFGNDLAPWPAQHAQLRADRRIREAAFQQSQRAARRELQSDGGGHQRLPPGRRRRLGRGDRCV